MKKFLNIFLISFLIILNINISYANDIEVFIQDEDDDYVKTYIELSDFSKDEKFNIRIYDDKRNYYINNLKTDSKGKYTLELNLKKDLELNAVVNMKSKKYKFDFETNDKYEDQKMSLYIIGYDEIIYFEDEVYIDRTDDNLIELMERVLKKEDIEFDYENGYVKSISNDSEKEYGVKSGWNYFIDRKRPQIGADSIELEDGLEVIWAYTIDLGNDLDNIFDIVDGDLNLIRDKDISKIEDEFLYFKDNNIDNRVKNFKIENKNIDNKKLEKYKNKKIDLRYEFNNRTALLVNGKEVEVLIPSYRFKDDVFVKIEEKSDFNYYINISGEDDSNENIFINIDYPKLKELNPFDLRVYFKDKNNEKKLNTVIDLKNTKLTFKYQGKGNYYLKEEKNNDFDLSNLDEDLKMKINIMYSNNLIDDNDGDFLLDRKLKRKELAKTLYYLDIYNQNLKEDIKEYGFMDLNKDDKYYKYMNYCKNKLYILGNDNFINPEGYINKEEFSVVIKRLMNGIKIKEFDIIDVGEISPYALESVYFVIENNIIKGDKDFKFNPKRELNRLEFINIIYKIIE
ncbi:MAG: DUF4430 domain-containing protein [Peptostreptococcaceae bacterium]|jgi:hypothetical protein|nr:DUF4430 domain-containing protein [Peptostreptococcaceae bacterium]